MVQVGLMHRGAAAAGQGSRLEGRACRWRRSPASSGCRRPLPPSSSWLLCDMQPLASWLPAAVVVAAVSGARLCSCVRVCMCVSRVIGVRGRCGCGVSLCRGSSCCTGRFSSSRSCCWPPTVHVHACAPLGLHAVAAAVFDGLVPEPLPSRSCACLAHRDRLPRAAALRAVTPYSWCRDGSAVCGGAECVLAAAAAAATFVSLVCACGGTVCKCVASEFSIGTWPVTGAAVCLCRAETGNLGGPGINWGSWQGYWLLVASSNHACAWRQAVYISYPSLPVSLLFRPTLRAWCVRGVGLCIVGPLLTQSRARSHPHWHTRHGM